MLDESIIVYFRVAPEGSNVQIDILQRNRTDCFYRDAGRMGDHFEFLNFGGLFDADFSMANIVFQGLDDPSLFSVVGTGGRFALVGADSDFGGEQVAPVPLPATAPLLLAGFAGLAALRRRRRAA